MGLFLFFRDLQVVEELFSFACPKFLSPVVPNYENVNPNYHKEPFQQQMKVFAEEVQQQAQLSTIRRYNSSAFMSLLMRNKNSMMCNELSVTFSNKSANRMELLGIHDIFINKLWYFNCAFYLTFWIPVLLYWY